MRRSLDPHHIALSQSVKEFLLRRSRSVLKIAFQSLFVSSSRTVREPDKLIRGSESARMSSRVHQSFLLVDKFLDAAIRVMAQFVNIGQVQGLAVKIGERALCDHVQV